MKWFEGLTTPDTIKVHYRKLAMQFHPDTGGDTETMQEINNAYHQVLQMLDKKVFNERIYKYDFIREEAIVNKIKLVITLEGITVEICGVWLWVTGETYPHRKYLKECGFKYSGKKQAWYFHNMQYYYKRGESWSMNTIRNVWGSDVIKEEDKPKTKLDKSRKVD